MDKEIIYKQKKLVYAISGSGPYVVLLHGFGGDGRGWKQQVAFLEKDFTVVVPQFPGSGVSELTANMSMESLADSVQFILKSESIRECCMIGHSMGGYVTLAFAEKYPFMLNGLGLFHSSAYADTDEKIATRRQGIATIQEEGPYEFLKNMIPNLYGSHTKAHNPSLIEQHLLDVAYFSKDALIAYYEAMINRPDRTQVLKQNKIPILFVLGRDDKTIPLEQGLEQSHLAETTYIHVLERSGHMGMKEEPEESNSILKNFLLKTV